MVMPLCFIAKAELKRQIRHSRECGTECYDGRNGDSLKSAYRRGTAETIRQASDLSECLTRCRWNSQPIVRFPYPKCEVFGLLVPFSRRRWRSYAFGTFSSSFPI